MSKLALVHAVRKIGLRSAIWQVRQNYHALRRRILVRRPVVDAGPLIENAVINNLPCAIGKMGSVEVLNLQICLKRQRARDNGRRVPSYGSYNSHALHVIAGVFPQKEETFDQFGKVFLEAIRNCDVLAAWDVKGEAETLNAYCPKAVLVKLRSLEPYFSATPWSRVLKGKRVLVISPFVASVRQQCAKREELWDNPDVLPPFELLTLRAPLSAGLVPPEAPDWFAALEQLKLRMDAVDYDVVLIGAGAFSLPLAVHAKSHGKVGIHLGGGLQILFGIIGGRWRENKDFKRFFKPSWRSPSSEETPSNFRIVEGGSYW
jgi:hypothetical protein